MGKLDILMVGIVIFSVLITFIRGVDKEASALSSIIGLLVALFVATNFQSYTDIYFKGIENELVRAGLGIVVLFVFTFLLSLMLGHIIITRPIRKTSVFGFGWLIGISIGSVRGGLVALLLLYGIVHYIPQTESGWVNDSVLVQLTASWFNS